MKKFRIEVLSKGTPLGPLTTFSNLELVQKVMKDSMEKKPLLPHRIITITEEFGNWQTQFSEDENKMLNCDHEKSTVCGWESCHKCKWSELTAAAGMYDIEELNR